MTRTVNGEIVQWVLHSLLLILGMKRMMFARARGAIRGDGGRKSMRANERTNDKQMSKQMSKQMNEQMSKKMHFQVESMNLTCMESLRAMGVIMVEEGLWFRLAGVSTAKLASVCC